MAQDYDNMGKYIFSTHPKDISQFVLDTNDVEVLENLDTEQQTISAQRTDTTARVRVNDHEAILHLELQLRDSTRTPMWARTAAYHGHLIGQHQLPVYSNVIYFHPNAGRNDPGMYSYRWNDYQYTLHYKVIRLIEIDGRAVLEMQAPGLLPFTPLMKPPGGMSNERWVQECVEATLAASVDQPIQSDLLYGIYLFGSIVHKRELFGRLIPEGLMRESKGYQYLQQKFTAEATTKATRETLIESTLDLLKDQFQVETVNVITPTLRNVNDLQKLKLLNGAAAKVQDIETFEQMIRET